MKMFIDQEIPLPQLIRKYHSHKTLRETLQKLESDFPDIAEVNISKKGEKLFEINISKKGEKLFKVKVSKSCQLITVPPSSRCRL